MRQLPQIVEKIALQNAIHGLALRNKTLSAKDGLWLGQKIFLTSFVVIIAAFWLVNPNVATATFFIPITLYFLAIVILRLIACQFARQNEPAHNDTTKFPKAENLPVYTILVPLYREANMLPQLTRSLLKLDYPTNKLDIKLIIEGDDIETTRAAKALHLPSHFHIILVPPSLPRTKPKALNFALHYAKGSLVTIYDAEDQPEADQLKKCATFFENSPPQIACLQAKLNFFNGTENWLTRQFTIEYTALFDAFIPALDKMGLPIPLGGTSNHFRSDALSKVGAWDAFNLTEDADLGMRLYRHGYECAVINSTTYEEANCQLFNWIKQRTRWLEGWMQTYFVHMRAPTQLWQDLGAKKFFGFQAVIGGLILSSLAHPMFYAVILVNTLSDSFSTTAYRFLEHPVGMIALFNLLIGYLSAMSLAYFGLRSRGLKQLTFQILFLPAYWFLISFAAYRAIYKISTSPFTWEKTVHGLSRKEARARCG